MKKREHYWLVVAEDDAWPYKAYSTRRGARAFLKRHSMTKQKLRIVKVIREDCVQAEAKRQQLAVLKRKIALHKALAAARITTETFTSETV